MGDAAIVADRRYEQGPSAYASQFQIPPEQVAPWFAARVAALITQGGAEQPIRVHTRWAIRHGCTRAQLEGR